MTASDTARSSGVFANQPAGLSSLFFVELWERFSYYGMRALLVLFMVLPVAEGGLGFTTAEAATLYGSYTMAVYMLAIPGGVIGDQWIGARRAVLYGGLVIAAGHFALALPNDLTFYVGLTLIALGTGLFKPNISALVGSLYAPGDERRDAGFSLFYMGINIGAFLAPFVTGFLAQSETFRNFLSARGLEPLSSWHWGFAAAGVGMTIAVMLFALTWRHDIERAAPSDTQDAGTLSLGPALLLTGALLALALLADRSGFEWLRWTFVALPVVAILWFATRGGTDNQRLAAVGVFFIASMVFWSLFEQAGVSIALFADQLTRTEAFGVTFPSSWFQSLNALFVILLSPLFALAWTRLDARQPSSPVKFSLGLMFLALSFLLMIPAAHLTAEGKVSPLWLVGLFFLQTVGELFLSPVGLSLMTRLAPVGLTGFVLGLWFLAAAFGNKLAGVFASNFDKADPQRLADFFLHHGLMVLGAASVLLLLTPWLKRMMNGVR